METEIEEAKSKAKSKNQAIMKVRMRMNALLREDPPETPNETGEQLVAQRAPRKFRDPADLIKKE